MRVADKMAYDQVNRSISKNRQEMSSLQNQAATQKRVTKPSDDPVAASRVLFSRVEQRGNEQYVKNLNYAKSFLEYSEQSLSELSEVLMRAKELAISQANDASASVQSRRVVAQEVKQLLEQAVQISNRKLGERFIFAGFKTTSAPFDENGEYLGDNGEIKIHIDKNSFLSMNLPGSVVFQGRGLSPDGFNIKSLQQPQTVDAMIEQKAEHPKKYGEIKKPSNQKGVDENQQSLNVDSASNQQSVSVNGGRGPASLLSSVSVGEAPRPTDLDEKLFPDGVNLFKSLKNLQISLHADDKFGVQESLDTLDNALQQVVIARTSLGTRVMTIDNTLNSMATNIVDNKASISQLEDADAFQVISDINKNESALQATLQTSGKMMQKSLMDFIS